MSVKIKGIYMHIRSGRLYQVLKIGRSVEKPEETLVIYKQLYTSFCGKFPRGSVWVRPLKSFTEKVYASGGIPHNRFERMECIEKNKRELK